MPVFNKIDRHKMETKHRLKAFISTSFSAPRTCTNGILPLSTRQVYTFILSSSDGSAARLLQSVVTTTL